MLIFLIAIVPAAVVVAVSTSGSRLATAATAAIAASLGALTGNPAYALLDVGAVAAALYFCWPEQSAVKKAEREEKKVYWDSPEGKAKGKEMEYWIWGIGCIGLVGYMYLQLKPIRQPVEPVAAAQTYHAPMKSTLAPPILAPAQHSPVPPTRPKRKSLLQKCLEIRDELRMVDCLERLD